MSRAAFSVGAAGAGAKPAVNRAPNGTGPRSVSAELPEHAAAKASKQLPGARLAVATAMRRSADAPRPTSRLELLLLSQPRKPQPCYQPAGEGAASQTVNRALKLAPQWTDVRAAIEAAEHPSASNLAFAIERLGCITSFASRLRREELARSGLVAQLLGRLQPRLAELDAGSLTLLLGGCARLGHPPPAEMLAGLAARAAAVAPALDAQQLPLTLWAFERLRFVPRVSVLAALEGAVARLAGALSPQGLTLCLRGLRAAGRTPARATLEALAARMQASLASFKPSELAACLAEYAAAGHELPPPLLQALRARSGTSVHSNVVSGKRPLGGGSQRTPVPAAARAPAAAAAAAPQQHRFEQPAAMLERGLAAASKLLQEAARAGAEPQPKLAGPQP